MENARFKEEAHAPSKSILFTWLLMAHHSPVSQERVFAELPKIVNTGSAGYSKLKNAMGCVY
jgi:hypothetical protein